MAVFFIQVWSRLLVPTKKAVFSVFSESAAIDWLFSSCDFDGQAPFCSVTLTGNYQAMAIDKSFTCLSSSIFPFSILLHHHHQVTLNFVIYLKLNWQQQKQRWSTLWAAVAVDWLSMPINARQTADKTVKQWNNRLLMMLLLAPFCPVDYRLQKGFFAVGALRKASEKQPKRSVIEIGYDRRASRFSTHLCWWWCLWCFDRYQKLSYKEWLDEKVNCEFCALELIFIFMMLRREHILINFMFFCVSKNDVFFVIRYQK